MARLKWTLRKKTQSDKAAQKSARHWKAKGYKVYIGKEQRPSAVTTKRSVITYLVYTSK